MNDKRSAVLAGTLLGALLLACDRPGAGISPDFEQIPSAHVPIAVAQQPLAPASRPGASASAPASASGSAAPMASASSSAAASGSGSAAAKAPAKTFECGDKGKPDCPMQKWMKSVAGSAVASGDNERLARAFNAMAKAPPGYGDWAGMCAVGAAKAQAGDFDGAKAMCKTCHVKYQSRYHSSIRDLKWP